MIGTHPDKLLVPNTFQVQDRCCQSKRGTFLIANNTQAKWLVTVRYAISKTLWIEDVMIPSKTLTNISHIVSSAIKSSNLRASTANRMASKPSLLANAR